MSDAGEAVLLPGAVRLDPADPLPPNTERLVVFDGAAIRRVVERARRCRIEAECLLDALAGWAADDEGLRRELLARLKVVGGRRGAKPPLYEDVSLVSSVLIETVGIGAVTTGRAIELLAEEEADRRPADLESLRKRYYRAKKRVDRDR